MTPAYRLPALSDTVGRVKKPCLTVTRSGMRAVPSHPIVEVDPSLGQAYVGRNFPGGFGSAVDVSERESCHPLITLELASRRASQHPVRMNFLATEPHQAFGPGGQ